MELSSISIAITSLVGALFSPGAMFTTGVNGAWYDPSDFSTMFQDAAGTTPVTAVEQPVGRILDKSGRSNHAFNPSGNSANFPVLQQDGTGRYYLSFNGVNQWLQTNSIDFTYGDKMFVASGVRKLASVAQMFVELSTVANSNAGSFYVTVSENLGGDFTYRMNGSGTLGGGSTASVSTPVTQVMSSAMNFARATAALQNSVRINGSSNSYVNTAGIAGAGPFGNYPLYIGARAGSSLWFNGRLYGLVVAGKQASASEIASTESWLNQKTGAY